LQHRPFPFERGNSTPARDKSIVCLPQLGSLYVVCDLDYVLCGHVFAALVDSKH
jgi:hypothetical protein